MANWLLLGPEEGEKHEFINTIVLSLETEHGGSLERYKFYPSETDFNEVISLLKNGSLFSPHKLVIIDQAHDIKGKKNTDPIIEYMKNPSPEGSLILTSNQPGIDKKIEKVFKNKKIFWEMFENQKLGWVQNFFKKNNYTITNEAAELILDLVENNTEALKRECQSLILFLPVSTEINVSTIEKYIYHSKEENVFTLFEKIASSDLEGALEIYKKIRLSGDSNPVQILSGLTWQIRNLLKIQYQRRNGFQLKEIFPQLGIRSKKNQSVYTKGIQNYRIVDLEKIIALASEFDLRLKGSRIELGICQMELLIYYIIINKGRKLSA
ncbi:DNA polymerase III subunit delta [Spirochaeta cellobiosiphila]|uniref:DNA polymerase III subunit delta n=1 Tax=Spirochaeta cellobiosiphila TaxID=504483 RepID=UPI0004034C4D|nr:DNA polymerase III subunit delta [Spirochaeta cellobiosiphila]